MEWRLLEMLAAEEPAEAFIELFDQARRSAAPEDVERLDRGLDATLRLVARREQRTQRERELAALYETAVDLTAVRDLQQVLDGIVRRARQLLNSDTAYLMLNDATTGRTYMRAAHGTTSPGFTEIELDFGSGLGGVVAERGRPFYTADYLTDERLVHSGTVDSIVKEEGLIAILGVALDVAGEVTGVLFAADRRERHYRPEEVQLLSSLGAHAAVAIENARLFEEIERVVAELHEANARAREHAEYIEWAAAAHDRFTSLVAGGGSLQDLTEAAADVLRAHIVVLSNDLRVLADNGRGDDHQADRAMPPAVHALVTQIIPAGRKGLIHAEGLVWSAVPIIAAGAVIGIVVASCTDGLTSSEQRALERVAQATGLVLLQQNAVAEAEQRVRGELLSELVNARPEAMDVVRERSAMIGLDVDRPHVVAVASVEDADRYASGRLAARMASQHAALAGHVAESDRLVLVFPADRKDAAESVLDAVRSTMGATLTVAVSDDCVGLAEISRGYREAAQCVAALHALGQAGTHADTRDLRFYSLLLNNADGADVRSFVNAALGQLVSYDAAHGTALVQTLEVYLDRRLSAGRAATALQVHPNTLYKRLDRIERLLGRGWDSAERSLQLQFALRLRALMESRTH